MIQKKKQKKNYQDDLRKEAKVLWIRCYIGDTTIVIIIFDCKTDEAIVGCRAITQKTGWKRPKISIAYNLIQIRIQKTLLLNLILPDSLIKLCEFDEIVFFSIKI